MTKGTKVDILYKIAMGENVSLSPAQKQELSKYRVECTGKPLTTKNNIRDYISAVDSGYIKGFYDWCIDNQKGDRRTKGGKAANIRAYDRDTSIMVMFFGWLTWGMAIYWLFNKHLAVGGCAIVGIIVSFLCYKLKRDAAVYTCILFPIVLAVLFFGIWEKIF